MNSCSSAYTLFLGLFFIALSAESQSVWKQIEPDSLTEDHSITAIRFYPDGSGYAAIRYYPSSSIIPPPVIYYTEDRGDHWEIRGTANEQSNIYSIDILSDSTCFLGGQDGINYRSTDSCQTYTSLFGGFGFSNDAKDTYFFNDSIGIASASYSVWKTYNGGGDWSLKLWTSLLSGKIHKSIDNVFYLYNKGLYVSHDFGESWAFVNNTPRAFTSAHIFEDGMIVAAYNGQSLFESMDNGVHWVERPLDVPGLHNLDALHFYTPLQGIGAGHTSDNRIVVLHTNDRGYTWETLYIDTLYHSYPTNLLKMQVLEDGTIYILDFFFPYILRGENYGVSSASTPTLPTLRLQALPNPVSDRGMLHWEVPLVGAQIQIINAMGAVVREYTGISGRQLEWSAASLPPGIYWARLSAEGQLRATLPLTVIHGGR